MKANKVLMLIISIVLLGILLVACNDNDTTPTHQHTIVIDEAVAATCTSTGLTEGSHCSECNEIIVIQETVPATGHNFQNGICELCGEVEYNSYGLEYVVNDDGITCYISGIGTCTDLDIIIPEYIDGYRVTGIGDYAFEDCNALTSIVMPGSVTSIGEGAFWLCSNLTGMVIPDGVTSIGIGAFGECVRIKSMVIPNSVTRIGFGVFAGCDALENIDVEQGNLFYHSSGNCLIETASKTLIAGCKSSVIPTDNSVDKIGDYAFFSCRNLTSVLIPGNIISIGEKAFSDCTNLKTVVISDGVESIGLGAFYWCENLTSVTIGNDVKIIGNSAFSSCDNLKYLTMGNAVTSIGESAFACTSIIDIVIPNSVTSIGDSAFYYCDRLTSIVIPDRVTSIGEWTFGGCGCLVSITIGSSVTSIGDYAFFMCPALVEIINKSTMELTTGSSDNGGIAAIAKDIHSGPTKIVNQDGYLFYTYDGVNYLIGYAGPDDDLILPEAYDGQNYNIYDCAFYGCSGITSVIIGKGVTSIGAGAFWMCDDLTSVTIESGVTSIGESAFNFCRNLTSITIGNDVMSIGSNAFTQSGKLESITVESGNIVYHSAGNCLIETATKTLIVGCKNSVIPTDGSVTSIGRYAFQTCDDLTSIVIPECITSIDYGAFSNCASLSSVDIHGSGTSIGVFVFGDCSNLTSITIGNGVESIGDGAFYNCSSLESIIFEGTKAQWNVLPKGDSWDYGTGNYTVYCTDGNITK